MSAIHSGTVVAGAQRLVVIGPVPPPFHGVSVSTTLVLANALLRDHFNEIEHVDISDHRSRDNIGTWDFTNVVLAAKHAAILLRALHRPSGLVYLPLAQNVPGFLRDSVLIHLAALRGWRVAGHLRGSEIRSHLYERHGELMRAWIRFTLRRLDSVAVPGESIRPVFDRIVDPARVAVVPNGTTPLDVDEFVPEPGTVVFLSSLRRRKGLFVALEAARLVLERRPDARFTFAGDWESDEVEREARNLASACGENVRFLRSVTGADKERLLGSAWAFLFPPVEPEGHSRVVLEALAAGLPTVTVDCGAIADTVLDGETGFVLPEPDPAALADRLLAILDDERLHDRMARAARERFRTRFTQDHADRWLADWLSASAQPPDDQRERSLRLADGP